MSLKSSFHRPITQFSEQIDILENNTQLLTGPELFRQLKPIVEEQSGKAGYKQVPSFKTIKIAGNEAGDFFFVPQDA